MSLISKVKAIVGSLRSERHRYMYWQRRFEDRAERAIKAKALAGKLPIPRYTSDQEARTLEEIGYLMLPSLISDRQIDEMRSYFSSQALHDVYRPELGRYPSIDLLPAGTHVAGFEPHVACDAPHAIEIANDPKILGAVSSFLGCRPVISLMHAWWSVPASAGQQHAEFFHRDYDDFKFVKLFVYLTDVVENSGPHVYVSGSARSNLLIKRRRFEDSVVEAAFPDKPQHVKFLGPAGTSFLEDTSGLHKGLPPLNMPRLIFQVLYSLKPNHAGVSKPVRPVDDEERRTLDAYTNGVYLSFADDLTV